MHSIGVVPSLAAPRNRQLALLDERPRLCPADAGRRLSRAWRHGLDGTGAACGEKAGGRLVTGRETKEGRRSVCAKPRGTRAGRFVLDVVHDRVDRQHRSHRGRRRDHVSWPVSFIAGVTARMRAAASSSGPDRRRDGKDAGSGFEFRSRQAESTLVRVFGIEFGQQPSARTAWVKPLDHGLVVGPPSGPICKILQ